MCVCVHTQTDKDNNMSILSSNKVVWPFLSYIVLSQLAVIRGSCNTALVDMLLPEQGKNKFVNQEYTGHLNFFSGNLNFLIVCGK